MIDITPPTIDLTDTDVVSVYDDLPLWAAPFGMLLLDVVRLRPSIDVLDIGCGTGFPLLEIAERLGPDSRLTGLDPWVAGLSRVNDKIRARAIRNVTLRDGSAEHLPFADASFDLIVSNNGINNVQDLDAALGEVARVARSGAQFVFTFNLPATMHEFYSAFAEVLQKGARTTELAKLRAHIFSKRKPIEYMSAHVQIAGFTIERVLQAQFALRFANASSMFAHSFMRLAFVGPWLEIIAAADRAAIFSEIERRLNSQAESAGGLSLTVPYACYDCRL
jgi:arsenite methyltransferase